MNVYEVEVSEVWKATVRVRAESSEKAMEYALEGQGEHVGDKFEYSHTLDDGVRVTLLKDESET